MSVLYKRYRPRNEFLEKKIVARPIFFSRVGVHQTPVHPYVPGVGVAGRHNHGKDPQVEKRTPVDRSRRCEVSYNSQKRSRIYSTFLGIKNPADGIGII